MRTQALLLALLFPLLFPLPAPAQGQQLDIQSLLREVEAKQKENSAKIGSYSYILKRTMQDLNDKESQ